MIQGPSSFFRISSFGGNVFGLMLIAAVTLHSQALSPSYRGLAAESRGLTGVTAPGSGHELFINPAGLAGAQGWNAGALGNLGLNSVLLDYAVWAAQNYRHLEDLDTLLANMEQIDNKWAPFAQAFAVNGRMGEYSLAMVSDVRYNLTIGKAVLTPVLGVGVLSDNQILVGRGFTLPSGPRVGVALKYLYRIRFEDRLLGMTDEAYYKVIQAWRDEDNGMSSLFRKVAVAGEVADVEHGLGMNLGFIHNWTPNWSLGLAMLDFPTFVNGKNRNEFVMPSLNLGVRYSKEFKTEDWHSRLGVQTEVHHFLLPGTPWFKQLKLGTSFESLMWNRPVASVSVGVNDGYPTFGLRMGFFAYLSYVYFAEELGSFPGQQKLSFHKLNVEVDI